MSFFHVKCKENTGNDIHKMFKTVGMKPGASENFYCTCWGRERKSGADGGPRSCPRTRITLFNPHFDTRGKFSLQYAAAKSPSKSPTTPQKSYPSFWNPGINFENPPSPCGSACNVQGQCMHLARTKIFINRATIV